MHVKNVVGSMLNISLIIDSLNFYVLFVVHYFALIFQLLLSMSKKRNYND
jgi:hypothetical protein